MANLMPPMNYNVTTGQGVFNGQGTKASHIAQVDQYQTWLAMVAHPMTPHILTGGNTDVGAGSISGLATSSSSFGDWHYVDLLIPPGATFLAWGVICLGYGQIRFNPYDVNASQYYLLKVKTQKYSTYKTAEAMETRWASDQIQAFVTDLPRAADMTTSSGSRHPRLVTVRYQIKKTAGTYFAVQSLLFQYLPAAAGTDFSGFTTAADGGTDL